MVSRPALVQATLDLALTPAVRTQDVAGLLGGVMARPWPRDRRGSCAAFDERQSPALRAWLAAR